VAREEERHRRVGTDPIAKTVDEEEPGAEHEEAHGNGGERTIEAVVVADVAVDLRSPSSDRRRRAA
jgi:hypothetical protein